MKGEQLLYSVHCAGIPGSCIPHPSLSSSAGWTRAGGEIPSVGQHTRMPPPSEAEGQK